MKISKKLIWVITLAVMIFSISACSSNDKDGNAKNGQENSISKLVDPEGVYNKKSDDSITDPPKDGIIVGDGSEITVGYDGSKGDGLSYNLFYIQNNGTVVPIGGGFFKDNKDGSFSQEIAEFNSDADGRYGFMELQTVFIEPGSTLDNVMENSTNITLGMYPIKIKISK